MKNITAKVLIVATLMSNIAMADCDYSKITKNTDGSFNYTASAHICVGQMKQDFESANIKLAKYSKVIELKDLAISKADERVALWMDTSFKMEDRLNKIDELRSRNEWLAFGLGALTVIGAGLIVRHTLN